ncbi:hypothetical protein GCM10010329_03420 [Streptomyces spiroverticillatus]|uniref:Uncharacterized protein n=1 Tax=Streptomyces finlayi TaxID=67296 RepID=A0A918WSG4_9ACTN|nr:hypothetical protein GCM10010329_03420 [Streptomyces spiroverticillatus]GHC78299.1 hypothetical protein GCM10010334_03400 [Streptomyces finlayi]
MIRSTRIARKAWGGGAAGQPNPYRRTKNGAGREIHSGEESRGRRLFGQASLTWEVCGAVRTWEVRGGAVGSARGATVRTGCD